jgi:hypothetical protein
LSHQQYTISAANKLADFLSDMLNNMQMQMSGVGSGKRNPVKDRCNCQILLKKQEGLGEKMKWNEERR